MASALYTPTRRKPVPPRKKGATWCVPYAIATASLLRSYEAAEDAIREVIPEYQKPLRWEREMGYRSKPIKGVFMASTVRVMSALGLVMVPKSVSRKLTLTQWYKQRGDKKGFYIVSAGRHVQLVHGTMICDNCSDGWVSFNQHRRYKRARIKSVYQMYAKR